MHSIDLYVVGLPTGQTFWDMRINYMLTPNTQLSALSANRVNGWQPTGTLFFADVPDTSLTVGWKTFKFSTPFMYDGKSSLVIAWSTDRDAWGNDDGGSRVRISTKYKQRSISGPLLRLNFFF